MNTKAERMRLILRTVSAEGLRWVSDGAGHRIEAIRSAGRIERVGECECYVLDGLPGQAERLAGIAGELAGVLGARRVRIDAPAPGVVVVVAEVGRDDAQRAG